MAYAERVAGDGSELSASRVANMAAGGILADFDSYQGAFRAVTRRARGRFEACDWQGAVEDAIERLDLYGRVIGQVEADVRRMLGNRVSDRLVWAGMKAVYSGLIAGRQEWEIAETFFNSVTRRVFATVGVDANIEFVDSDFGAPSELDADLLCRSYRGSADGAQLVHDLLRDFAFEAPFQDLHRDAGLAAARLRAYLRSLGDPGGLERVEILREPFFRRKGAYLVGRLFSADRSVPFALALLNGEDGIVIDAVLAGEDDISILFSFTRSHFHVDLGAPHPLVSYLNGLMPRKPVAEIYIALGYHKHGKTELYRSLLRYLRETDERFDLAPGTPGMVMVVFAMPGYDVVLKVIRDRFPVIKPTTPDGVRENYRLVFRHDRAGRLVEAQEFEHLEFDRSRFAPRLLQEFQRDADRTVAVGSDAVIVHHGYIERRVAPLDLYFRQESEQAGRAAAVDFGQAVKDLAANGIFPGELLPKNFGVTRHGRVVCYDYDELSLLTDFFFREFPEAQSDDDEYSDGAWYGVGPRDVFPQEFARFLGLPSPLREALEGMHGDLYSVRFWQEMQARVRGGEIVDIFPYHPSRRLHTGASRGQGE